MGISGLLPALKSITEAKTIDEYRGKTLAIDGYCWLHRAIYSCSEEICLGRPTDKYITYFLERVTALQKNQVTPYVVFDGGPLPMKKGTEDERRKTRQKNRELGMQHYNSRNFAEARKCFVRAADVSPFMAHRVIQALKARGVRYVVAPYEADAQLAFLVRNGLADGVITEDSDCLPFGCHTVLFKMDRDGVAQEIRTQNLKKNKGLIFHMFTEQMFLDMCILSGCDYLASIPGFGLKKAYLAIKQHGTIAKVVRALRLEGKVRIPPGYEQNFARARLTFLHQRVYDPSTKRLVPLTPPPDDVLATDMDFLGPMLTDEIATAIAVGDVDPISMKAFQVDGGYVGYQVPRRPSATPLPCHPHPPARHQRQPELLDPGMFRRYVSPSVGEHGSSKAAGASRGSPSWKRKLPRSFGVQPRTSFLHALSSSASASGPAATAKSASPAHISRFFAANAKRMSPASGMDKKSSSPGYEVSEADTSFESQGPVEVDVSESISLEPSEEKAIHSTAPRPTARSIDTSLTSPKSREAPPPVKENAFARMMRAGAVQHKASGAKRGRLGVTASRRPVAKKPRTLSHRTPAVRVAGAVKATKAREPEAEPSSQREKLTVSIDNQREDSDNEPRSEESASAAKPGSSDNWLQRFRFTA